MGGSKQQFGGDWTQEKLDRVRKYLRAYMTIMKEQPFSVSYIDAFAGTGYIERKRDDGEQLLFPELASDESQAFIDGSARVALGTQPPFTTYIFVEKSPSRFQELGHLKVEFPALAHRISLVNADANGYLRQLCTEDWRGRRAVLFLDPFGMSVDWATVEAIAATKAIDLWYLFPLGVAVGRLLVRDGQIPEGWRQSLNRIFGTTAWHDVFYRSQRSMDLFGEVQDETGKVADYKAISRFFVDRLKTIFPGVAKNPLPLLNRTGIPLFLLCFAASNPKGSKIAVRIADHLLSKR